MPDAEAVARHLPLKPLDFGVLLVLVEGEEYGYQIVKRIADVDAGGIKLAPSNLYSVLDRMIDAGLVEDRGRRAEGEGPSRRYYGITELGRQVVSSEAARLDRVLLAAARLQLISGRNEP